ncbi:MAG TPA: SRPBCC family protein [Caulobacteraceae bacterium]|jgi:uncharacterized protein YndB with AHSA1/START domain|nr:SRPBCC family protein [Caulobacteraceae bacterium]
MTQAMIEDADGTVTQIGDGLYELRFERFYRFPLPKVWAAITDPERLADWLAQAGVDLRLGGEFALTWPTLDYSMSGRIVAFEPPRLLAWTWPDPKDPDGPASVVRWELAEAPGGCRLVLTNGPIRSADLVSVAGGWHAHLEDLHRAGPAAPSPWSAEHEQARLKHELAEIAPRYRARLAGQAADATG